MVGAGAVVATGGQYLGAPREHRSRLGQHCGGSGRGEGLVTAVAGGAVVGGSGVAPLSDTSHCGRQTAGPIIAVVKDPFSLSFSGPAD